LIDGIVFHLIAKNNEKGVNGLALGIDALKSSSRKGRFSAHYKRQIGQVNG
jgi:hypothetical protein